MHEPAASVPCFLSQQGIRQVVAPLLTRRGQSWLGMGAHSLILFPYLAARTGMEAGLTLAQWRELGAVLAQVHRFDRRSGCPRRIRVETFRPAFSRSVREIDRIVQAGGFANPHQAGLARLWIERRPEILGLTARAEKLGRRLRRRALPLVLCHCDIHTANVLVGTAGELFIVDWDAPRFAPHERDLMFHTGSRRADWKRGPEREAFFSGYGPVELDPLALAYYRFEWVVQELGDFGERVFRTPGFGDPTLADSLRGFAQLFAPGDVVEEARLADEGIDG